MGVGSGAVSPSPWIFINGTNIVDRGLIVLFFGLFCYFSVFFRCIPLPLEEAYKCYFLVFFPLALPENFFCQRP